MQIVVSVRNHHELREAERLGADLVELRLDLLQESSGSSEYSTEIPRILTLRSRDEGGAFAGDTSSWAAQILPQVRGGDYVDVEEPFRGCVPALRSRGARIIGSTHRGCMLSGRELVQIEQHLRTFADIPKIVVTPSSEQDVLDLCSFTSSAEKPLCTGVMGSRFAYARAFLPFFGSALAYCHAGTPVAVGQYHIRDFRAILALLRGTNHPP
jgi:3-dehydroquinate dehydratase-1